MINVLMIAGNTDAFSLVYFSSNNCEFKYGTPFTRIYTIKYASTATVAIIATFTRSHNTKDNGVLLYDFILCIQDVLLIAWIFSTDSISFTASILTFLLAL